MSIRLVLRRGAGLVAAVGLLAGLGAAAPAAQAATRSPAAAQGPAGYLFEGIKAPASVKRGHSVVFPIYFMQNSPDTMQVLGTGLRLFSWPGSTTGVVVNWYDPFTHRWVPSTGNWGTADSHYWQLPAGERLMYRPGVWGHVYVRITFTSRAHLGKWAVVEDSPYEYQLWGKGGTPVSGGYLDFHTLPTGAEISVHA